MEFLKKLLSVETKPVRGLLLFEWVMLGYVAFTLLLMVCLWGQLMKPGTMLLFRVLAVLMTIALWRAYRKYPCRMMMMLRVAGQMILLSKWYPDTYELNRIFPNLDHVFASWEQSLFGCQPALLFSQQFPSPVISELLSYGYVSYFFLIGAVALYYFLQRYDRFFYAAFVILASFFLFYVIFIFLPVAGPQFYYEAVGLDEIARGVFPDLGHYFQTHQESLTAPGWHDGLAYHLLEDAHKAGERPTAAFPSSHVGISVILLWLAWEVRSKKLFFSLLPFCILMFFATFYIQAHYVIDAIAGLFAGTAIYFLMRWIYSTVTDFARLRG